MSEQSSIPRAASIASPNAAAEPISEAKAPRTSSAFESAVQAVRSERSAHLGTVSPNATAVAPSKLESTAKAQRTEPRPEPRAIEAPTQSVLLGDPRLDTAQREVLARVVGRLVREEDRAVFELAVRANRRTESHEVARFSTLRTTAGESHRASYGVAQLTVREHLTQLERLSDGELEALGIARTDVDAMRSRGDAVEGWYRLLVGRDDAWAAAAELGLAPSLADDARELARQGDGAGLVARFGADFASGTGLPRESIAELARTRMLGDPELRAAFRAQYEHDHGAAFAPADRDPTRMAETVRNLVLAHPELEPLLDAMGGTERGAGSLGHYLGVGDVPENLFGWYARAAEHAVGRERFEHALVAGDPITSTLREAGNVSRAQAALAGVGELDPDRRVELVARIARCFHGAPARARAAFFVGGDLSSPRFQTEAELEAGLDAYVAGRPWSDARLRGELAALRGDATRHGGAS